MSDQNFENLISSPDETHNMEASTLMSPQPRAITTYQVYIGIISPGDNLCNLSNQLILDCLGPAYQLQPSGKFTLNGQPYAIVEGIPGLLTTINAVNSDKVLGLQLQSGSCVHGDPCINTPYGFKLSTLIQNMGATSLITPTNPAPTGANTLTPNNGWTNMAHLIMNQKAYKINKGGRSYTVFNFTIKNVGQAPAQKVLFKDVIPEGATLCQRDIFVKYSGFVTQRLTSDNYELNGRMIYILLKNLQVNSEVSISLVCVPDNCSAIKRVVNVGALTYVAYQGFDQAAASSATQSTTVLVQQVSNPKPLTK